MFAVANYSEPVLPVNYLFTNIFIWTHSLQFSAVVTSIVLQKRIFCPILTNLAATDTTLSKKNSETRLKPKNNPNTTPRRPTNKKQKKSPQKTRTTSVFCSLWTNFSIILCSGDYKDAQSKPDPTKMVRREFAGVFCLVLSLYFLNYWFCWKRGRRRKQNEQFVKISTVLWQKL